MTSLDMLDLALGDATDDELAEAIRAAIARHLAEDHLIDFKDGRLCDDTDEFRDELRKQACGFANAEGGVLVVGVAEGVDANGHGTGRADSLRGCTRLDAHELAARALAVLPGARPRIRSIVVDGHTVLIVAVTRSEILLRFPVKGKPTSYYRMGESSQPVPPHLEMDLVLGRRQRVGFSVIGSAKVARHRLGTGVDAVCTLAVQNDSLAWANEIRVGVVAHGKLSGDARASRESVLTTKLRQEVEAYRVMAQVARRAVEMPVRHHVIAVGAAGPFDAPHFTFSSHLLLAPGPRVWCAALYVSAPNAEPHWFGLRLRYSTEGRTTQEPLEILTHRASRPIVFFGSRADWDGIPSEVRDAR